MKSILSLLLFLCFFNCKAQDSLHEYYFAEVGWTIKIDAPKFADTMQFQSIVQRADKAINQTFNSDIDLAEQIHPLFTIIDGNYNLFGSTVNLYDSSLFHSAQESYDASKKMILQVLSAQAPSIKIIDTLSGSEFIDGLRFEIFRIKTFYTGNNVQMTTYWFYRKQNGYDFSVNIAFTDEEKGEKFLDIFRKSTFTH